jgi:hypothetical protein
MAAQPAEFIAAAVALLASIRDRAPSGVATGGEQIEGI